MDTTTDRPMGIEKLNKRMAASTMTDPKILIPAIWSSILKLNPRHMIKNPVMFVVEIVATLTTILFFRDLFTGVGHLGFALQINIWLWFTVVFANFAEAVAEGRGKAQAAALRQTKTDAMAKLLGKDSAKPRSVPASELKQGDIVLVEAGDLIPSDGDVIEGVASVNEAAITGESAPVIRESGGDRSAVTGGTTVISDWIKVRITAAQGHTFLDRMIALVEGAERQKTPNEIALNILLAGLTIIFVFAVATIPSFAAYAGGSISVLVLVALFVTLIPTTIGALLSAIGIAGMDRLVRFNVLAMSGRAVEAAGDVDTLLLDKTGTITLGNRQATEFLPISGVNERDLADAAQLSSLSDENSGRTLHCRSGQGKVRHPRPGNGIPVRPLHSVHGADAHQRHRRRRLVHPQGRCGRRVGLCPRTKRHSSGGRPRWRCHGRDPGCRRRPGAAARRLVRTDREIRRHTAGGCQGR